MGGALISFFLHLFAHVRTYVSITMMAFCSFDVRAHAWKEKKTQLFSSRPTFDGCNTSNPKKRAGRNDKSGLLCS